MKVLIILRMLLLNLLLETGLPFYVVIFCMVKTVPSFLSYFKTLNIGLPGIKTITLHSTVKHTTG